MNISSKKQVFLNSTQTCWWEKVLEIVQFIYEAGTDTHATPLIPNRRNTKPRRLMQPHDFFHFSSSTQFHVRAIKRSEQVG